MLIKFFKKYVFGGSMKEYIWLTISMILIMNMCKAAESTDTFDSIQQKANILHANIQSKYPHLSIRPITVVADQDYLSAQMQQTLSNLTTPRSPFHEDLLDDRLPLESQQTNNIATPIVFTRTALQICSPEEIERAILANSYLETPYAVTYGNISSAAIKTLTAYSLILANSLRTPQTTFIANPALAATLKCLVVPIIASTALMAHQTKQAHNFANQHYQADPLTPQQQTIQDIGREFQNRTPETQDALLSTQLSTQRMLELAQK